ncbi:hypothetical protein JCM19047_4497 [Bacillus sp. JCM 19047]|nr:hypothetical protein JCM19047_4497 [Bacillus sp. JCM 19047]
MENSLRHGFTELKQTNTITIRAYREGTSVVIDVLDNGVGLHMDVNAFNHALHDQVHGEKGFALRNTHQRLIKTFGFTCGLMAMETDEGHIFVFVCHS